ncbi:MAG TPA: hypothetical protein VJU82_10255 [Acidobacteriaceae bacterium]|nr:hypothetical protein [Acidobacteriaceae bacterium]
MHGIGSLQYLKSLSLAAVLAASGICHASTITFDLVGVNTSAGTLPGTVNIDTATKLVTSADITFNYAALGSPIFTTVDSAATHRGLSQDFLSGTSNSPLNNGGRVALYFDTASLGFGSLDLCLRGGTCTGPGSYVQVYNSIPGADRGPIYITSGELDPDTESRSDTAPTPEPPSLILLGTGILFSAALLARFSGRRTEAEESQAGLTRP